MLKVQSVIKIRFLLILIISFYFNSCTSQSLNNKEKTNLGYKLIEHHYKKLIDTGREGFLYDKTMSPSINTAIRLKFGLSNFFKYSVSLSKKCNIDSLLSVKKRKRLDFYYKNLKMVELDQKYFKNPKILNDTLEKRVLYNGSSKGATKRITFPIIIQEKGVIYSVFVETSSQGGTVYFYKKEGNKWILICNTMLYIV